MHISIAERLKPFDHTPGTTCLLPGSNWTVQIFPALICLYDFNHEQTLTPFCKIAIDVKGPVSGFTVQLNLEKGNILVFGTSLDGYFRYRLTSSSNGNGLLIDIEKSASKIEFKLVSGDFHLSFENDKNLVLFKDSKNSKPYLIKEVERLSLGNHKAQDWTLVKKRADLGEIFPVWLRLGQLVLHNDNLLEEGDSLLKECESAIKKGDVNHLLAPFHTLFLTGFQSLMTPRVFDDQYQGITLPALSRKCSSNVSPLVLLSHGAKLIRSCFASYNSSTLSILPALPVEFHAGRFLHFRCENLGLLDLEWSKKTIRRMILFAESDGLIDVKFQKEIKCFRFREESSLKPEIIYAGSPLKIEKGKTYFFDCFKK